MAHGARLKALGRGFKNRLSTLFKSEIGLIPNPKSRASGQMFLNGLIYPIENGPRDLFYRFFVRTARKEPK